MKGRRCDCSAASRDPKQLGWSRADIDRSVRVSGSQLFHVADESHVHKRPMCGVSANSPHSCVLLLCSTCHFFEKCICYSIVVHETPRRGSTRSRRYSQIKHAINVCLLHSSQHSSFRQRFGCEREGFPLSLLPLPQRRCCRTRSSALLVNERGEKRCF